MRVIGCLAPNRVTPCLWGGFAAFLPYSDLGVVMRLILSGAAVLAAGIFVSSVQPISAQSIRAIGGPAEMPPADFQGQQYVDSRGCVFMRAGLSGKITWVARIGRDRKPICNDVPMAAAAARLAAPEMASQTMPEAVAVAQPSAKPVGQPMATVASNIRAQSQIGVQAPVVVPGLTSVAAPILAPAQKALTPRFTAQKIVSQSGARCPAVAPVLQRMVLQSGGTVLVCTRTDGSATGWVSPGYPAGVGGTIKNPMGQQVAYSGNIAPNLRQNAASTMGGANVQTVIAGAAIKYRQPEKTQYVAAWKDGRLNPLRGKGTAQGWAQQAQVWTQKAPAKLVATKTTSGNLRVTQSTMSSAAVRYVQIGTFGNPNNVANVAGALSAMGLPVSKSSLTKGGRDLVIVLAGPFDSAQAAKTALGMARQAGFGDAFLR